MTRLVRSELMKLRTTNVWWLFGIGILVFTGIALLLWIVVGQEQIDQAVNPQQMLEVPSNGEQQGPPPEFVQQLTLPEVLRSVAANIYTAGQFFGLLFAMLLSVILVTNEYFHQTATATFLTTPKRTKVIMAKLATAALASVFFWALTTLINIAAGAIFFSSMGYDNQLGEWSVQRSILMNGLAFGLWGVLGVGLGVLIRSQIGAVLTGAIAYLIGSQAVQLVFFLVYEYWIKKDWVLQAMVSFPTVASQVMISAEKPYEQAPVWWVGALVLVAYGVVFGTIGTLLTRKRDIS